MGNSDNFGGRLHFYSFPGRSRASLAPLSREKRPDSGALQGSRSTYPELTEATMADNPFEERAEPNPFQVRDDAAPAPSLSAFLRSWSKLFLLLPERVDRVMSPRTGCPARTRSTSPV